MRHPRRSRQHPSLDAQAQLSLPIDGPPSGPPVKPTMRQPLRDSALRRGIAMEEILWMRDVVHLTRRHRCTIHRWMHRGLFPKKNAPRGHPRGWLRSTIERWLVGSPPTAGREVSRHAPLR